MTFVKTTSREVDRDGVVGEQVTFTLPSGKTLNVLITTSALELKINTNLAADHLALYQLMRAMRDVISLAEAELLK